MIIIKRIPAAIKARVVYAIIIIALLRIATYQDPARLKRLRIITINYEVTYAEYRAFPGGLIRPNGDSVFSHKKRTR